MARILAVASAIQTTSEIHQRNLSQPRKLPFCNDEGVKGSPSLQYGDQPVPQTKVLPIILLAAATASGETRSPRLQSKVEPECTAEARKERIIGSVLLGTEIDESGQPLDIEVIRSLGHGLDEEAIEALEKWQFEPGRKDGEPIKVKAQIQISFRCE